MQYEHHGAAQPLDLTRGLLYFSCQIQRNEAWHDPKVTRLSVDLGRTVKSCWIKSKDNVLTHFSCILICSALVHLQWQVDFMGIQQKWSPMGTISYVHDLTKGWALLPKMRTLVHHLRLGPLSLINLCGLDFMSVLPSHAPSNLVVEEHLQLLHLRLKTAVITIFTNIFWCNPCKINLFPYLLLQNMYYVGITVFKQYFRYLHGRGFCTHISHNSCYTKYISMCKHLIIETSSQKSFIVRSI